MMHQPLFTVMVHTFNRPALLKFSVEALQRQTYGNLEIILINNGAIPEIVKYIHEIASSDNRVKLLHFQENQYSEDDPLKYVHVCWNDKWCLCDAFVFGLNLCCAFVSVTIEHVWVWLVSKVFACLGVHMGDVETHVLVLAHYCGLF